MAHEKLRPHYVFDQIKIEQLKQIAPECFEDGKINFETLRQNIGDWSLNEEDPELEHFGLFWPGKRDARKVASLPPEGTLQPVFGDGLKADGTTDKDVINDSKNIFIEGENLEVLKLLQKSYSNKVKLIYIDPPYNTGNDFVYDDDFTEPLQEYLRRTGQVDEEGKALTTNKKSDGRFHSKWLSMIYPRLRLARNLLREDGVIFVSIDDNEVHNLRAVMNEIFGEENFIAEFNWVRKKKGAFLSNKVRKMTEYVLCYQNEDNNIKFYGEDAYSDKQQPIVKRTNSIKRLIFPPLTIKTKLPDGIYPKRETQDPTGVTFITEIDIKNGIVTNELVTDGRFVWSQEFLNEEIQNGSEVYLSSKFGFNVLRHNQDEKTKTPSTLINKDNNVGTNEDASKEIADLFNAEMGSIFDYAKPTSLINYLINFLCNANEEDIILDFFAGSATTAHSVMNLNEVDTGNRRYICIQLPEINEESSAAFQKGLKTISEVSKERIRLVSKKISQNNPNIDLGFKSYYLKKSNYRKWKNVFGLSVSQLEMNLEQFNENPLIEGYSKDGLLTEIILLEGFTLCSLIKELSQIKTNKIKNVSSDYCKHNLLICLDEKIHKETIKALTFGDDDIFICLDSAISTEDKLRLSDKGLIKTI